MTPNEDASSEDVDPLLDKVIAGNFRVQRLLGSGAMGNVYQAEQLSLGKAVAIKVLHPHLMSDEKLVRRFQREAKSASRLNHPNSIQIIDSGQDAAGVLYIAMELLTGRDLAEVIRDEFPLPIVRIVRIMSQVLSALDEAHAQGVIHRDLKPSNIMLIERRGEPDFVKVCDYGIAKAQLEEGADEAQMLTIQGLVCGTPEYMSPEQARGEPLDGRADLYSASVILYHMVTGDIPFRAGTPIGIVSRHLSEAPAVPSSRRPDPSIPPDLDDLILRGLAKSRELRPATAGIFREELENIGSGRLGRQARANVNTLPATAIVADGSPTTLFPAVARSSPPPRSRGAKVLAIGLIVAAAGSAAALIVVRRSQIALPVRTPATTRPPSASAEPGIPSQVPLPVPPPTLAAHEIALEPIPVAPAIDPPILPAIKSHLITTGSHDRSPSRKRDDVRLGTSAKSTPASPGAGAAHPLAGVGEEATAPLRPPQTGVSEGAAGSAADLKSTGVVRGPRETIAEAERLLAQGEVGEACRRGEDAKKAAPGAAPAYKFLGKCYMRAGNAGLAKENYRRYLELAPHAPDALFIESIVK